jgi:uncharacterized protein DUF3667
VRVSLLSSGSRVSSRAMRCPNCGTEHAGAFCNQCGQSNVDLRLPIGGLIREAAEEALGLDSRLRHTLVPFFLRPGEVTRDYLAGRRVRYTSPLKMYVVAAALYFFAFALNPHQGVVRLDPNDRVALEQAHPGEGRVDQYFRERAKKLEQLGQDEGPKQLASNLASTLPKALVLLLPIFALLLKLFWRKRYYAEHLVFALHIHAYALIVLVPGALLPGKAGETASAIATILCVVYLFLALRKVYGDGRWRTFAKFCGLGFIYLIAVSLALAAAGIASLAFI